MEVNRTSGSEGHYRDCKRKVSGEPGGEYDISLLLRFPDGQFYLSNNFRMQDASGMKGDNNSYFVFEINAVTAFAALSSGTRL